MMSNVARIATAVAALAVAFISVLEYRDEVQEAKRRGEPMLSGTLLVCFARVGVNFSIAYGALEAIVMGAPGGPRNAMIPTSLVWLAAGELYVRRARRRRDRERTTNRPA